VSASAALRPAPFRCNGALTPAGEAPASPRSAFTCLFTEDINVGIAGARLESRRALAWNGRVPSRAARDARFFEGTPNSCARTADAARSVALQQARANRACRRPVLYNVLTSFCCNGRARHLRCTKLGRIMER
jgi:hypothetical protein